MDAKRVQQIINSKETVDVLHNGSPVWLEGVIPEKNTAKVRNLHGKETSREVPVTELIEG